jgi:hypothetical protein
LAVALLLVMVAQQAHSYLVKVMLAELTAEAVTLSHTPEAVEQAEQVVRQQCLTVLA